jgi:hypothetical protein
LDLSVRGVNLDPSQDAHQDAAANFAMHCGVAGKTWRALALQKLPLTVSLEG